MRATSIGSKKGQGISKVLVGMVHGKSYALEVNLDDDIDNFLTLVDIFWSQVVVPCNEYVYSTIS